MSKPHRTPPEGMPFRRARETNAEYLPPHLTPNTGSRLHRHIEWAMMQRDGWRDHLRVTVNVAAAELRLAGLSPFEVARVLSTAVQERGLEQHPHRGVHARVALPDDHQADPALDGWRADAEDQLVGTPASQLVGRSASGRTALTR